MQFIKNPFLKIINHFIFQPFGSQKFPDFLLFNGEYVFSIEIKYSTSVKNNSSLPKWNSTLPKENTFYIYGKRNKDIIFFNGNDFLNDEARNLLQSFFEEINEKETFILNKLKNEIKKIEDENANAFGLKPYIRKDYNYDSNFSTNKIKMDIFDKERSKKWTKNVFDILKNLYEG